MAFMAGVCGWLRGTAHGAGAPADEVPAQGRWLVRAVFGAVLAFVYVVCSAGMDSDPGACWSMMNNVLLAYLPVEIALHVHSARPAAVLWPLVVLWTLFFPNAPYVLTDYFHLAYVDPYVVLANGRSTRLLRPDLCLWLTFTVLSVSALVSVVLGTWSLDHVAGVLQARLRRPGLPCLLALVVLLSALAAAGIYLGRFPRLNSVDMLMRPRHALGRAVEVCRPNMLAFVVLFTWMQTLLWLCLRAFRLLSARDRHIWD